jgi:peptidoglycan/xylan/chitin deacetylase (PgdA/CDA1 family)
MGRVGRPARATVNITLDFDAVAIWMSWGATGARALSRGELGPKVGAPRLLEIFDRLDIPTTWFVPGHTAETYPDITAKVVEMGHEVGVHGYMHTLDVSDSSPNRTGQALTNEQVREHMMKAKNAIERVTGYQPVGLRAPAGDYSGDFFVHLLELGFIYDSSNCGEFFPEWCRDRDTLNWDGPNQEGNEIDVVECPLSFELDDFNYFTFNYGNPNLVGLCTPKQVMNDIWKAQFDYMYDNCPGGVWNLTIHPQCTGWGFRAAEFEKLLVYMGSKPGTRFTTVRTVAEEFMATHEWPSKKREHLAAGS